MAIQSLECPHCGAPIPPSVAKDVVVCAYCCRTLVGVPGASWGMLAKSALVDEPAGNVDPRRVCVVLGRTYLLEGRLAAGESSDVFLASRAGRVTERVIIKVLRALADEDLHAREWRIVHRLHASAAQGAAFFTTLLPQPVVKGIVDTGDGIRRSAIVYRWRSGFQHTLEEVRRAHAGGVTPRAAVWMWRRLLDLLGWVHRSGFVHGAVLPHHLLIHPRDHGVVLCGWSCATELALAESAPARNPRYAEYYRGGAESPAMDIAMSARSVAHVLGGDPAGDALPGAVPAELARLVRAFADGSTTEEDAWALRKRVGEVASRVLGPPRYERFDMPGWR